MDLDTPTTAIDHEPQEVNMNELLIATPQRPEIKAVGMNGCTAWFIWTTNPEQLICVHVWPEPKEFDDLLKESVDKTKGATIVAIVVVNQTENEDEKVDWPNTVAKKFKEAFPEIETELHEYPQQEDAWDRDEENGLADGEEYADSVEWNFEATLTTPGEITARYIWTWERTPTTDKRTRSEIWDL